MYKDTRSLFSKQIVSFTNTHSPSSPGDSIMKSITLALAAILAPMVRPLPLPHLKPTPTHPHPTSQTLATPTSPSPPSLQLRAPGIDLDALPSTPLTWTGSITSNPSDPLYTFTGTAQSIYEQIVTANPSYATLNPVNVTAPISVRTSDPFSSSPDLDKRQRREIDCNSGDPVATGDCAEGLNYLRALGNGEAMCGANANGCARVSCSWRCGLELCNFGTGHFQVKCRDIARDIVDIMARCTKNQQVRGRYIFDRHYTRVRWHRC